MEIVGLLYVYRNKKTGDYLVQAMSERPDRLIVAYDAPITVPSADMTRRAAPWIITKLKEFSTVPFEEGKVIEGSPSEFSRFSARHHSVGITLYDDGTVEVQPFRRNSGGGYAGMPDKKIRMKSEEMEERVVDAILDRFAFLES